MSITEEKQKEIQDNIREIEAYYCDSLTNIIVRLSKSPIVRYFKGNLYRVLGVGQDCVFDVPQVIYVPLDGSVGRYWTRELTDFLSPIDPKREDNKTGQKRRFEFVETMVTQLDLVKDEELIQELYRRTDDLVILQKDFLVSDDWVIARVIKDSEADDNVIYDVQNVFDSKEDAEENLERNRRHRKLLSNDYKVLHRIYVS